MPRPRPSSRTCGRRAVGERRPLAVGLQPPPRTAAARAARAPRRPGAVRAPLPRERRSRCPSRPLAERPDDGGGRLLGEGCHFVDFACWLAGELPDARDMRAARRARAGRSQRRELHDPRSTSRTARWRRSSTARAATPKLGKEYVEAHVGRPLGGARRLRDGSSCTATGERARTKSRRDKGHEAQFAALAARAETSPDPLATMAVTLAALRSAETGATVVPVPPDA